MSERLTFGVDFGTSNSAIASTCDGKTEIYDLDDKQNKSQPSSVFIRIDGYHSTGRNAIDDFRSVDQNDIYHFIPSVKPGLPFDSYDGNVLVPRERGKISSRFFPVEELASFVIADLKTKAEAGMDAPIEHAAIGKPVVFSTDEAQNNLAHARLKKAADLAGFKELIFIEEPVAAAIHYERFASKPGEKNVLVFDFGGGTLDVCILELDQRSATQNKFDLGRKILASHGVEVGGTDLDKDIFYNIFPPYFGSQTTWSDQNLPVPQHIFSDITEWHLQDFSQKTDKLSTIKAMIGEKNVSDREAVQRLLTLVEDQQIFALLQKIEETKISFSDTDEGMIKFHHRNIDINTPLSLNEYESYISERRKQISDVINETLQLAQMGASEIDTVIRVGGSSRNPFVEKLLLEYFNEVNEVDPFLSVVSGLSIAADNHFQ